MRPLSLHSAALCVLLMLSTGCATTITAMTLAELKRHRQEVGRSASQTTTTPAPGERPTYSLGDRWIRSDGIYEVIRVEPDHYVFSAGSEDEIHLSKDLTLARYRRFGRTSLEFSPTPKLDWPLAVGKHGTLTGKFRAPYAEPYDATLQWAVEDYEAVTVPAGTYQAFRIKYTITPQTGSDFSNQPAWAAGLRRPWNYRMWYAPEIRQLIKTEGDAWQVRFDLVAIDPAETEPLRVELREPTDQAQFTGRTSPVLTGKVSGGMGIANLAVVVNGEIVLSKQAKGTPKKTMVLNADLPLRDGKNVVLVTATDPVGVTSQEARTVFYVAPLEVALPPPGPPVRVNREYVTLTVPVPAALGNAIVQ